MVLAVRPKVVPATAFGRRFRSTTEARWATFLTALGVAWEYEPETYDLDGIGWYLPDFWLPDVPVWNNALSGEGTPGIFLEVKPAEALSDAEYNRVRGLHIASQRPVVIALGYGFLPTDPNGIENARTWPGALYDVWTTLEPEIPMAGGGGANHHFAACVCGRVDISFLGYGTRCGRALGLHRMDTPRMTRAYTAGASFRPDGR